MLGVLPSVGDVGGEAAAGCVLHHQRQVGLRQDRLKGVDDVDMPLAQVGLNLGK